MSKTTDTIKQLATEEGIDLIGVANLDEINAFKDRLSVYKDKSIAFFSGDISDKVDYTKVWDQTKSIISFGILYKHDILIPDDMHSRGIIASFAHGEDYHIVLKHKAKALMSRINESLFSCNYKIYIDTGVLSDRVMAYSAGLGFYGKNNFIINPQYGSFIFLGHILLDIGLEGNDRFMESFCADCRKCIDACPTNAIKEDRQFDHNKCISYLTQKGINENTYGYLYGCDICQNACPFNQGGPMTNHAEFITSPENAYPKLTEIISLDQKAFLKKYGKSTLRWRGLKTLKANAQNILTRNNDDNLPR